MDDQSANLAVLEALLAGLDATLVRADSGAAALRALLENAQSGPAFALILLEVRMPALDALQTAELIRRHPHPHAQSLPIVFVTDGDPDAFPFERADALGQVDYLARPLNAHVLRARLGHYLACWRKDAELECLRASASTPAPAPAAGQASRLRLILDNLHDYAFIGTDTERRITEWEAGAEAVTGWSAAEACGQSADMLFTPEDRAAGHPEDEAARARATGRSEDKRWHLRKDGGRFFADGMMIALRKEGEVRGELLGFAKIMRDATAEHEAIEHLAASERALHDSSLERERLVAQLRTANERMRDIFYHAPAFMAVLRKPDMVFEMANERFAALVGRRPLLGRSVRAALPELEGQGLFELLDGVYRTGAAHEGSNVRLQLQTEHGELDTYYVDFIYMALREPDGTVAGVLIHGIDVTERTRANLLAVGQRGALELAVSDAPLGDVLDLLARTAEDYAGGAALVGIQLAGPGNALAHAAAPSLPDALRAALDGVGIAPLGAGGGTAAWRAEPVDCADIARDPLWERCRVPALAARLAACSALPIIAPAGAVLGAFTWYYRAGAARTAHDAAALDLLANTASLVIGQRAEATARQAAEERSHAILESMTDGFLALDASWRIAYANGAAERITGMERAQLFGDVFWDLFPDWHGSPQEQACRRCATGRGATRTEVHIGAWGGWYEINCFPTPGGGIALYLRDESERRLAEEGVRRLAAVAEQSSDFIGIFAPDGAGLYLNRAGRAMAGLQADAEIRGVRLLDLFSDDCRAFVRNDVVPALTGGAQKWEGELRFAGREGHGGDKGVPVYFKGFAVHGADGAHLGLATITRDITEQKRAEDELRRIAADLSEADHRKSEFLATLAHELRNPLAPIRTGLDLLRMAPGNVSTAERVHEMMDRQLGQLIHLVDDLLDIARITRGRIELKKEQVDLRTAVAMAVESSTALIQAGKHQLQVSLPDEPLPLDADPTRLVQVLSNLLNNAAKYTPGGGRIALAAWREDGQAVVSVTDSGIGIAPEAIGSVFEMFTQVRSSLDRAQGGLGIGLSLVRRLVELHGGRVHAFSAGRGRGSTFTVRLPLRRSAGSQEDAGEAAPAQAPARRLRVLVVDDNVDAADSLAALLGALGHDTRMAHDGPSGLAAARAFLPDLALLDIGLPGMNGHELARAIRASGPGSALCDTVLVALTGWGAASDMTLSHEAGFDQHLTKPVSREALEQALATATEAHIGKGL
ncbi:MULTISPECIES: PAS domain-containing protein [unclassified Massilia]|uniref:PAS domain-containing protein n=1 Tax=unclassified Massilia TaxID=2609279 RepID=UPI00177AA66F|nr:PAS domain-containing protein [Massilia sp. CFBP 13647]MBD8671851.1 PAS domain-containing protein [Massilia sp. CFBP 13721]